MPPLLQPTAHCNKSREPVDLDGAAPLKTN